MLELFYFIGNIMIQKKAVCALILTKLKTDTILDMVYNSTGNKYLAVSRKNNHALIGLPGGKVDLGETELQALIRELQEELEINFNESDFDLIYEKQDSNGYITYTYLYKYIHVIKNLPTPKINSEGALITLARKTDFCSELSCPFYEYNTNLFNDIENI